MPAEQYARLPLDRTDVATPNTFEVGLALAGAVSGGAYAAGVIDFLMQALDAWYAAKKDGKSVPTHEVLLRAGAGASAGSINGVLIATAIPYVFSRTDWSSNPFYKPWVKDVSIQKLLTTSDLDKPGSTITSVLNSDCLDDITKASLDFRAPFVAEPRRYFANPLKLAFTLTNLRGVPYTVSFNGGMGAAEHGMASHSDYMRFAVTTNPGPWEPGRVYVDDHAVTGLNASNAPQWTSFAAAVVASAAFPIGLRYRELTRPLSDYECRTTEEPDLHNRLQCVDLTYSFQVAPPPDPYTFVSVDGGCMDNEPFELVRIELAGILGRNPRDGDKATRAVLMIDPFPEIDPLGPAKAADLNIATAALGLITSWKEQARFKPEEVALALDESVYSRFLIAPVRKDDQGVELTGGTAIAAGALGGFSGFLSESYRDHDFFLGRRNCQQFLRCHFVLPISNELVAAWAARPEFAEYTYSETVEGTTTTYAQIIPLIGDVAGKLAQPPWPKGKLDPSSLKPNVEMRLEGLYKTLTPGRWDWLKTSLAWHLWAKPKAMDYIMSKMTDGLKSHHLL